MSRISSIVSILKKYYKPFNFGKRNPYKTLIACILSLRTKDEVTYPASQRLFKKADTPKKMIKLSLTQIEQEIYPVGFYHTKAKRIKEMSKRIINHYHNKVPDTIDELMKLKGVGRKTANIVITHGFNKLGIAVDTHVHRISNRLDFVKTKNPTETEFALRKKLPKKYWIILNDMLVQHGQTICKPISPFCSKCPISKLCPKKGVGKRR